MNTKNIRIIVGIIVVVIIGLIAISLKQKSNTEEAVPGVSATSTGQSVSAYIEKSGVMVNGEVINPPQKVAAFSGIKTENMGPSNVIVSWTTSLPVMTEIYFSSAPPAQNVERQFVRDTKPKTVHAVELTSLTPNTTYYYTILSVHAGQKIATTTIDGLFKTLQK